MEVADLAEELQAAGHQVQIFTVQWERKWPKAFQLREIPVVRINRSLGGAWGMFRFVRELKHQISEAEVEGVIVYGLNEEAWGAIRGLVSDLPLVVRIHWNDARRFFERPLSMRHRTILGRARRLIVDSIDTAEILGAGSQLAPVEIVPACGRLVPGGARLSSGQATCGPLGLSPELTSGPTMESTVGQARAFLSEAHPILTIGPRQPLVVCGSNLQDPGIEILLKAWRQLVRSLPYARLWLLGNGRQGREVWERVVDYRLSESVVMPGFFDQLEEVLRAADLYLHATTQGGDAYVLSQAMAMGRATISLPAGSVQPWIGSGEHGRISPNLSPESLCQLMLELLGEPELRRRLGEQAARSARDWDLGRWVHSFSQPLQEPRGLERDSGMPGG